MICYKIVVVLPIFLYIGFGPKFSTPFLKKVCMQNNGRAKSPNINFFDVSRSIIRILWKIQAKRVIFRNITVQKP